MQPSINITVTANRAKQSLDFFWYSFFVITPLSMVCAVMVLLGAVKIYQSGELPLAAWILGSLAVLMVIAVAIVGISSYLRLKYYRKLINEIEALNSIGI